MQTFKSGYNISISSIDFHYDFNFTKIKIIITHTLMMAIVKWLKHLCIFIILYD